MCLVIQVVLGRVSIFGFANLDKAFDLKKQMDAKIDWFTVLYKIAVGGAKASACR